MKAKLAIVTLVGFAACRLALAQNEPAATPAAEPPAAPPAAAAPAAPAPDATIPLIQFQDVPLTTAIDNLARQASINYILDPKVGYGQPDERGQIRSQPNISIRWENLTAAQALSALITTYGLQLVEDPKTKISRVTIKDPAAPEPLQTRIYQLKYAAPSNVMASVQTTFTDKRSKVVADVRTSQLVLSATEKELDNAVKLLTTLDTPTKQVLIEAKLVETSLNPQSVKGINWAGTLEAQHVTYGNNNRQLPPIDSITQVPVIGDLPKMVMPGGSFNPATAFLDADGLSVVISFLNQSADSKVIATPRTVTLDNEEAVLSVTRAQPIFKNTAGTQGSPGGSEVTYTNLGVILNVTPRISANNYVNLHVLPQVSRVSGVARKIVAGTVNEADIYDIRQVDTRVMVPSGNTLVLGGLVSDGTTKGYVKVPLLGDIPYIGLLFRQDSKKREQSNLIIFITPTIVEDSDFHASKSDYLQTSPDSVQADKPWGAWNSGVPAGSPELNELDWSK